MGGARSVAPESTWMFREAAEAPAIVRVQRQRNAETMGDLAERLRKSKPRAVVTLARGSSDHAATFARYLIETRVGVLTSSASPSVGSIYDSTLDLAGTVVLAISQSGRSPDLLATAKQASAQGALLVAMVNEEESPLAAMANVVIPLSAGTERSVAATKSFIASLAATVHLLAAWTEDNVASHVRAAGSPPVSDEQQLRALGHLDEVAGTDDPLDLVVEVVHRQVVHVRGHPAGPQVAARGDDLLEELGDVGHVEVGDGLLELRGGHVGHPGQAAEPLRHVGGGVAEQIGRAHV